MKNVILTALNAITLGDPVTYENITMIPLVGATPAREDFYLTLDDALACGLTEITEISEQGSVPELRVVNKGAKPVFILDGEELLGAKQNRVVNLSILVPAEATLTIPVSCVEAGRWRSRSRAFRAAPRTQYAAGRAKRMAQVTASMQISGARASDQADVWADIAAKSERLSVESPTGAMEEIFVRHSDFIERALKALPAVEQQVGALFQIDGRVVGFDLFDRAATLRRLLPKLVRSVAVDALDRRAARLKSREKGLAARLQVQVAEHFLASTAAAAVHEAHAIGLGRDLRLVAHQISGAALEVDRAVVHLSAFHL
jgi:hypothetical protein